MKCIYCGSKIVKIDFKNLFICEDRLCLDCRNKLKVNKKYVDLGDLKVETFYNYDEGIFRNLLIQYKECYDEALSCVFLYILEEYIRMKYRGYKIVFIPSSKEKLKKRGFNHLELIFATVKLAKANGLEMKEELIQEGKNIKERRMMVDNYIYKGDDLDKVLIVDDVITTGSSILGAYQVLKPHCKRIRALALGRKENAFI